MKHLLQRKAELEKEVDELIRTTDHDSPQDRSRMIENSQPLMAGLREIEITLSKQRADLGRLIQDVLAEASCLAKAGSNEQLRALLEAVGDLPREMFDQDGFKWDVLRQRFSRYQQDHTSTHDYVRTIEEIHRIG